MVQDSAVHSSRIIAIDPMLGPLMYLDPSPKNWKVATSAFVVSITKSKQNLIFIFQKSPS